MSPSLQPLNGLVWGPRQTYAGNERVSHDVLRGGLSRAHGHNAKAGVRAGMCETTNWEPSTYEPAAAPQEHNGQVRWDRLDLSIPELLPPDGNSYGGGAANSTPQPQREQVQSAHPGLISKPTPIPMPAPAQTSAMAEGNVHPDSTCDFKKQMLEHVTSSRVQLMLESAIDTSVPGGVALAPHVCPGTRPVHGRFMAGVCSCTAQDLSHCLSMCP
eukprot:scaffold2404_cov398-Prasinococcus_capsulatus_cf.AAC.40